MPLRPDDHAALRFFYHEIFPFMIAGRRVRRQWFVRFEGIYRYTGGVAAALAGLGVGGPFVGAFAHPGEPAESSADFWARLTGQFGPHWV
jgi:hypothetical protein